MYAIRSYYENIKLEKQVRLRTRELKAQNMLLEENREEITQQKYELEKHKNHLQDRITSYNVCYTKLLRCHYRPLRLVHYVYLLHIH